MRQFVARATEEHELMFTTVGENDSMLKVLDLYATAFDWQHLAWHCPRISHIHAFRDLWYALAPILKDTHWPSADIFANVRRTFDWQKKDIEMQYRTLFRRVRTAVLVARDDALAASDEAKSRGGQDARISAEAQRNIQKLGHDGPTPEAVKAAKCFVTMGKARVKLLFNFGIVTVICQRLLREAASSISIAVSRVVAAMVSEHLGALGEARGRSIVMELDAGVLRRPFSRWRCHENAAAATPTVGAIVSVPRRFVAGKNARRSGSGVLGRIVGIEMSIHTERIAAALFTCPWFALGGSAVSAVPRPSEVSAGVRLPQARPLCCWHCVRIIMRGQLWTVTEVPCEGNGSLLHSIWETDQKLSLQDAWTRVYLKQAQIMGLGSCTEKFLASVAVQLLGPRRALAPALRPGARSDNARRGLERARNIKEPKSIRHAFADSAAFDAASATAVTAVDLHSVAHPFSAASTEMPKPIAAAFKRLYARDREQCAPLPRHAGETQETNLAGSVLRAELSDWMESEAGRQWKDHEQRLLDDVGF